MNRQGYRLFITLSITKNRQDVFKAGRHNNFLYHRFTFRILPHRPYMKIQSQVSIRSTHGKMAVQMYTVWTQSGPRLFITLSITKNRQDVFKAGRHNNFLYDRFTFRILPHRPYMKIQSQVSICSTHGKMAVQMYTVWTQSGPSLFPVANQQGADGLQQLCNGIPGRYHHLQ